MTGPIIVLGMHASGTSLVSHILIQLGVNMGTEFMGPVKGKPTWEDRDFVMLNAGILTKAGGNWFRIPQYRRLSELRYDKKVQARTKELLGRDRGKLWGWKDPRQCLTMPVYMMHIKDAKFVRVLRNPGDTARSILARGVSKRTFDEWIDIGYAYNWAADCALRILERPTMYLQYEDLMNRAASDSVVGCIADLLEIEYSQEDVARAVSVIEYR